MTTRLSDKVAERIAAMIAERGLKPGDRLPAERLLAEELGVGRSSLREAIGRLAAGGRLSTRRGGGTYVGAAAAADGWAEGSIVAPLSSLLGTDPDFRYDVLEIRQSLEGAAARNAALRATAEDKARIASAFEATLRSEGAGGAAAEARADASFHLAIARASHNVVVFQVLRGMFDLLQATTTTNLEQLYLLPRIREPLARQHRALMEAVVAGDPEAAEAASDRHIAFVGQSLRSLEEDAARRARAAFMPVESPGAARPAA